MGLLAALFLVGQPVVIQKTLEIRPDVPALPFFLAGLWFLLRGLREREESAAPRLRWFLGGGLCFGAAIMCTQKMLFVLPGAFAGLGLWALAGGRRTAGAARILAVLVVLVGVAVPFAVTWAAFAVQGGGHQFIHNNFLLNAKWRMHSGRHIQKVLATSWPIVALGLVGAAAAMVRFYRARQRAYGDVLLLCTLGGLIAGLCVVPAAYRQYYLMPLPIVCVFAAQGLCVPRRAGQRTFAPVAGRRRGRPVFDLAGRRPDAGRSPGGTTNRPPGCATSSSTRPRRTPSWTAGWEPRCFARIRSTTSSCTASCW